MDFQGGGERGDSGDTISVPEGRDEFVSQVVSDFEGRRIGVEYEVVGYILSQVLEPEDKWRAGLEEGRFELSWIARLIEESLDLAADRAEQRDRLVIDVSLAEPAFHEVVEGRYRCAFPFLIC